MKMNRKLIGAAAAAVTGVLFSGGSAAQAASGVWSVDASGIWSNPTNWAGGIVADGAGNTADFSTLNIVNNDTVSLDSSRTIGQLKFGDTVQSNTWTLDSNGNVANVLTLNNGSSQPIINITDVNQNTTISATLAGVNGFNKSGGGNLILSGNNTYSGRTYVTSSSTTAPGGNSNAIADLVLASNQALGTSDLYIDPGTGGNLARVLVNTGIVIPNNVTIHTSNGHSGFNGSVMSNGNVDGAGFSGTVNIDAVSTSGGAIVGPFTAGATVYNPVVPPVNFLTFSGPINLSPAYNSSSANLTNSNKNGVQIRAGHVILSGGGSYFRLELRSGLVKLGANNGISQSAYIDLGVNANFPNTGGNPENFAVLDLAGFNQTMVGVEDLQNTANNSIVTNSASTPVTLTLAPLPQSANTNANLAFSDTSGGVLGPAITDNFANGGGMLNLVINGAADGVQTINTGNSTYSGSVTLTSGTLAVNSIHNGGTNSSLGASSNAASNLVFNGGTLQYTGGGTSSDRDWTTNTTATFSVSTATARLTMSSGGGSGGTGVGGMTKIGAGILEFSGVNSYTGPTNINAGTLLVNGSLAAASKVSVASAAILGGNGSVGGSVTPLTGGIISPGDPATSTGVGTLTVGSLNLSTGSFVNFELVNGGTSDQITVANSGGLTINSGAKLDLYVPGTLNTFGTAGTYPLFNISGGITGSLSNLVIATPAADRTYAFNNSGGFINLTIATAIERNWTDQTGNNLYSTAANWAENSVPNGIGQTAVFGTSLVGSNGTVTLTAAETVGGVVFNNSGVSYNLGTTGGGSFVLNNGAAAAAIDDLSGTHSINVPLSLAGPLAFNTTNATDLITVGGNMSGAQAVTVAGPGSVTLTGTNTFTTLAISNSTVNVGVGTASGTLGSGAVTLVGGAALNFNLSSPYNFGQAITGAGTISQLGSGTTTVGAVNVTTANSSAGTLITGSIAQTGGINVTGTGSLTAAGTVSGAGKLIVNTTGSVSLGAANSYSGGTDVVRGTLIVNAAGALPANSVLNVSGGVLDLHGNNISVANFVTTATPGGIITNNVASPSVSTITFNGVNNNYPIFAAINDGSTGGKVAVVTNLFSGSTSGDGLGTNFALMFNASSNYSGGTTVNAENIEATASNAFGTGLITVVTNNSGTNLSRVELAGGGITIPNAITIQQPNAYPGFGAIQYHNGSTGSATLTGTITQNADAYTGGTFGGPTIASGDRLIVNGPVLAAGTATTIIVRSGNVAFGGGGSYPNLVIGDNAVLSLSANNGIATNAAVNITSAVTVIGTTTVTTIGTLDLAGFNQSIAGLTTSFALGTVTNSNTSSPSVLTIGNATADTYSGTISGPVGITKTGAGVLLLNNNGNNYTGNTILNGSAAVVLVQGLSSAGTGNLVVNGGGLVIQGATSLSTVSALVRSGFNNGLMNGPGINSSAAASDTSHLTTVGVIANDNGAGAALYATFEGANSVLGDILVKRTYFGDTNLNGSVDGSDYSRIDNGFLSHGTVTGWYNGDFNYDGVINGSDYTLIDNAFNTQGAVIATEIASPTAQIGGSAVPEPTTLGLIGIGAIGVLARRRRRN